MRLPARALVGPIEQDLCRITDLGGSLASASAIPPATDLLTHVKPVEPYACKGRVGPAPR